MEDQTNGPENMDREGASASASADTGAGMGMGMIVGILIAIIIVVLFFMYGLPALRGGEVAPVEESNFNIDVTLPDMGDEAAPVE